MFSNLSPLSLDVATGVAVGYALRVWFAFVLLVKLFAFIVLYPFAARSGDDRGFFEFIRSGFPELSKGGA